MTVGVKFWIVVNAVNVQLLAKNPIKVGVTPTAPIIIEVTATNLEPFNKSDPVPVAVPLIVSPVAICKEIQLFWISIDDVVKFSMSVSALYVVLSRYTFPHMTFKAEPTETPVTLGNWDPFNKKLPEPVVPAPMLNPSDTP